VARIILGGKVVKDGVGKDVCSILVRGLGSIAPPIGEKFDGFM